jgi:hypothetical protein
MDRPSPFGVLSLQEFDGLSFEEKLAYLDLQLTSLYGEAWRNRVKDSDESDEQDFRSPAFH